tara:strand:- start:164 stop:337 length:174 start_codon:yes stop_codon:yes gene_type:complete
MYLFFKNLNIHLKKFKILEHGKIIITANFNVVSNRALPEKLKLSMKSFKRLLFFAIN